LIAAAAMLVFSLLLFGGCASRDHVKLAKDLKRSKYYEEALDHYFRALKANPHRIDLKIDIDGLLKEASVYYFLMGQEQLRAGDRKQALYFYKKSIDFDPGNNDARRALTRLTEGEKKVRGIAEIKKEKELNIGLPEVLKKTERVNLEFNHKTSLKGIFDVLSKAGNVNILFDPSVKDRKVTLKLVEMTFYEALEQICLMFNYSYYVLNDKNILVTADNTASGKKYRKLLVKDIFLANVEAAEAKQTIEAVFRPQRLVVSQSTNSLIITDTLENIALVEKLVQMIDKRKGELEVEVEIMEVDRKKLEEYGTELSAYNIGAQIDGAGEGMLLNDLYYLGSDSIRLSMPRVVWKFFSSITDSKILARPKIRGLDKKKVTIKLGEKRPIPRTTFVPVAGGGVNQQPITSYDMTDVGISITFTPLIHNNREVTLQLKFELTYVTDIGGAYVPPTLGNRTVQTELRLRDGETGIIAGLMRGTSTGSKNGIPLLNRIPLVKEIFSSNSKLNERTDILLSITPRILRMPQVTAQDLDAWLIGTQEKVELKRWQNYKHKRDDKAKNKK
jgi:general secretion pathway protein D